MLSKKKNKKLLFKIYLTLNTFKKSSTALNKIVLKALKAVMFS